MTSCDGISDSSELVGRCIIRRGPTVQYASSPGVVILLDTRG